MIQFVGPDKKRQTIRLGKMSQRNADALKTKIEQLVSAQISGYAADDETQLWLGRLDSAMLDKLANAGLIPRQEQGHQATLKGFVDAYIAKRIDVKGSTATVYGHTRRNLIEFFGADMPLRDISPGDADEWRLYLIEQGLAEDTTVRRRCGIAKQYFTAAVRKKLIASNPFSDLKSVVQANGSRSYFVTQEEAEAVLDACPDAQWRLIFALSRYGGLRCPSEHLSLKWADVDWVLGRVCVRSPKTEHHPGGEFRILPIFPELRPYLEDCRDCAEPGTEYVITRYRDTNANLRTQLLRIIKRAHLKPWPKLFHNLRATRETELAEDYPMHVVCAWIGNSQAVAAKHYLQVTDDHFEKATDCSALQKALQQPAVSGGTDSQLDSPAHKKTPVLQGFATSCENLQFAKVGDEGLEPPTSTV